MELTVKQALQKALEAHKTGQVQEADRLYTAILKVQPDHPVANHNLGILGVATDNVDAALPYLQTALEANPTSAQFWVSYIDALTKLHRFPDAIAALHEAKSKGIAGVSFDKLERLLQKSSKLPIEVKSVASGFQPTHSNTLDNLKLEQAIKRAKKQEKDGNFKEAKRIYQDILFKFPRNKRANDGLKGLAGSSSDSTSKNQDPSQIQVRSLINLYTQSKLEQAIKQVNVLIKQFPNSALLFNIQGAILSGLGQLDLSVTAYKQSLAIEPDCADTYNNLGNALKEQDKLEESMDAFSTAVSINPEYAEAYNNIGTTLKKQGKLEEAMDAFNTAVTLQPDYAEAHYNIGNVFKEQRELEDAIKAYTKSLSIKPDYAKAHNNLGVVLQRQGKLKASIAAYKKAIVSKNDYAQAIENFQSLVTQLYPVIANYGYDFHSVEVITNLELELMPKYQILSAIKAYLENNFNQAVICNNNFKACSVKLLEKLSPIDRIFCHAYSIFVDKLIDANWDEDPFPENELYHLGESHCLSYAHRTIALEGARFKITPRITFGAKAYHFSVGEQNAFQSITKYHLSSLPKNSMVFLSYGEIDCRAEEGFISVATKHKQPIDELIDQTAQGYVSWFLKNNADQNHELHFVNVPAPVYNEKHSADLNSTVAKTVALFNAALNKYTLQHGLSVIDVFKFTVREDGFSNAIFHVDKNHLGARALVEIQKQLA